MRQLFSEIKAAGFEAVFQNGAITVLGVNATIVFGEEDGVFSSYLQQNMPEGPVFTAAEDLSKADVLQLCSRHISTASVAA